MYAKEESLRSNTAVEFLYTVKGGLIGPIVPVEVLPSPTIDGLGCVDS